MPQVKVKNKERQEEAAIDARNHRERIIDMQQWCAQYPELETLKLTLARARYEFERLAKEDDSK